MDTQDRATNQARTQQIASVDDVSNPLDTFGKIIAVIVVLEVILIFVINLFENNQINTLNNQLSSDQTKLASSTYSQLNNEVNTILSGQQQLTSALDSKVQWTNFYNLLDGVTPKSVQLNSITIGQDGSYKASGQASSLSELAEAMSAWSSGSSGAVSPFSSVTLNSEGYSSGPDNSKIVSFSISGQVNLGAVN